MAATFLKTQANTERVSISFIYGLSILIEMPPPHPRVILNNVALAGDDEMRILVGHLLDHSKAIGVRTLIAASALPVLYGIARAGDLADITTIAVPGAQSGTTTPFAINNSGEIAGEYLDPAVGYRVFSFSGGAYATVDQGPSIAVNGSDFVSLNNSGQIVGFANTTTAPDFGYYYLASGGSYSSFPPGSAAIPNDVVGFSGYNDQGDVAGYTADAGFISHDGVVTIVSPPGATSAYINAINNSGDAVGQFDPAAPVNPLVNQEAFLYQNGVYTTLLPPNAQFVEATGINDNGEVVGYFDETPITGPSGIQITPILGFTYADGVYREYSVPGEIETELFGINDAGEVVGYYSDEMGDANGFSATAVPEPSTWAMMLIGFAGLGFATIRRAKKAAVA